MDKTVWNETLKPIADRNVAQVNFVAKALKQQATGIVGGRPDGGMAAQGNAFVPPQPSELVNQIQQLEGHRDALLRRHDEARQMIDGFEVEVDQLKTKLDAASTEVDSLIGQLTTEREARAHLEDVIRRIADLLVNGSKAHGT